VLSNAGHSGPDTDVLFSGKLPEHLTNVDVYVNKAEPTATLLDIVQTVLERYVSEHVPSHKAP
jgi:hypothetical protein